MPILMCQIFMILWITMLI